jgi:hypothetical protein
MMIGMRRSPCVALATFASMSPIVASRAHGGERLRIDAEPRHLCGARHYLDLRAGWKGSGTWITHRSQPAHLAAQLGRCPVERSSVLAGQG